MMLQGGVMRQLNPRTGSLLRLVRISKAMELSPETIDLVEHVLFDSLGLISTTTKTKKHEETVRRLIEEGESWGKIKPVLLDWWRVAPSPILAGKILELTYLNAGHNEIKDILSIVSKKSDAYWKEVHPAVRTQIVLELFNEEEFKPVTSNLAQHSLEFWLLPIERLASFVTLVNSKMQSEAFEIFSKFESTIIDAVINFGVKISVPKGWVYLNAGKAAVDCGFKTEAVKILKNIRPDDSSYQAAAKHILSLEADEKNFLKSEIASHLLSLDSWSEREEALRVYLDRIRQAEERDFELIPILNTIFAKSAIITVQDPTTLNKYVKLCLENIDLVDAVPNILASLKHNILNFHSRAVDGAIWQNVLLPEFSHIGTNWKAVGLLHRFIIGGSAYESNLFKAFEIFDKNANTKGFPTGLDFELLKEAAAAHLGQASYYSPEEKELMYAQLNLATADENVRIRHCEDYISRVESPNYEVLERLLYIAKKKESPSLINAVIKCFARHSYLRNSDLETLWSLSASYKQFDNAWRVATILESRKALKDEIHFPWKVSGEKRTVYSVLNPAKDQVEICLQEFDQVTARACMAFLTVGNKFAEMVASIDSRIPMSKIQSAPEGSTESDILESVAKVSWLEMPSKRVGNSANKIPGALIPTFASTLPSNRWSALVSMLCEITGLSAIGGDITKLQRYAEIVASAVGTRSSQKVTKSAASKWLKTLSPSERTAWHDLYNILRKIDPLRLEINLGKFIVRLATMLNPAHYEALTSLQQMNASLSYLRDLESFILSDEYTQFRSEHSICSKVPVPEDIVKS